MMRSFSLRDAAHALGVSQDMPDASFFGVNSDTRQIKPGDLYVALRGEHFDGHGFLAAAVESGAVAAVVAQDHGLLEALNIPILTVADTRHALGLLGRMNRDVFTGPVIAVTGSCGKTTVKEIMASIMAQGGPVLATQGNLNNEVGVPLTLFRLGVEHQSAVIELGASGQGEIAWTASLARPQVAVLTNAGEAHLEGFGGYEGVVKAKGEIIDSLNADGCAILNAEDPAFSGWRERAGERLQIAVGIERSEWTTLWAESVQGDEGGWCFTACAADGWRQVLRVQLPGRHNLLNALMAVGACRAAGATAAQIKAGLSALGGVKGRLQSHRLSDQVRVIDDTYNANPTSMRAALSVLAECAGLRWVVLGDMAELGDDASTLHRGVAETARTMGLEQLWCVGQHSKDYQQGFGPNTRCFETREALVAAMLAEWPAEHLTVLVKGSRSAAMDLVVAELLKKVAH